jgi:hypothetical protein
MNRRSAIKGLGLLAGAIFAAPHLIGSHENQPEPPRVLSRADRQREIWREFRIKLEKSMMFGSNRLLA